MIAAFVSGVSLATFAASGYFFLRFWRKSGDSFFLQFCIACWLLATERVALVSVSDAQLPIRSTGSEASSWVYLIRLAAFVFILTAIIQRNHRPSK